MGAPASFGSPYNKVGIQTTANTPLVGYYNVGAGPSYTVTITTSASITAPAKAIDDIGVKQVMNLTGQKYFFYLVPGVGATDNDLFTITQPVYTGNTLTTPGTIAFTDASVAGTYHCRLAAEDQDGMVYEKELTVVVGS